MDKIKLFTHTDLDGIGCAVLAKMAYGADVDIEYCDYDNINEKIENFLDDEENADIKTVIITDISVNERVAERIDSYEGETEFYLLDHHPTALYLNYYDWCMVEIDNEQGLRTCGTELFYNWLRENGELNNSTPLKRFVEIVRDYDTWRWAELGEEGEISKKINNLMWIYGREKFIEWVITKINNYEFPKLSVSDELILYTRQKDIDGYIESKNRQLIGLNIYGYSVGVVYADRTVSELGNKLSERHPEFDFIMIINLGENQISLRTVKDINLGEIAKKYGGGGHPKAAGIKITPGIREGIVTEVLEELG